MTQKRLMDEQMFNTEKLASLGTLAAGVAHEINNPLTAILGFTDLMLEKFPPESREYQDLRIIEERAEHCRHIVENLLDYARVGTSLGDITSVNNDIDMVLQIVGNTLLTHKITLERNLEPDLPTIRANSKELQQVFLNLVNNAVYAMKEKGGTLAISSALRGNRIMVKVADSGTGIPLEIQSKIFDPFFTTKGVGEGTGLGLSVSLGIVQKLGGTITVKSSTGNPQTGEPSGSVFTVILPLPTEGNGERQ
jgi:signal transduction histidine kinase